MSTKFVKKTKQKKNKHKNTSMLAVVEDSGNLSSLVGSFGGSEGFRLWRVFLRKHHITHLLAHICDFFCKTTTRNVTTDTKAEWRARLWRSTHPLAWRSTWACPSTKHPQSIQGPQSAWWPFPGRTPLVQSTDWSTAAPPRISSS